MSNRVRFEVSYDPELSGNKPEVIQTIIKNELYGLVEDLEVRIIDQGFPIRHTILDAIRRLGPVSTGELTHELLIRKDGLTPYLKELQENKEIRTSPKGWRIV